MNLALWATHAFYTDRDLNGIVVSQYSMSQKLENTGEKRRHIALYPGAFRPPHAAHFMAVRHLVSRPHVDEVVIIISNRCRPIPGTTKALDADVARQVWAIYLEEIEKVRVEIAQDTAIRHAMSYFERVAVGDTLEFCIGEADLGHGDDRFKRLEDMAKRTGVDAALVAAPTGGMHIRSTALREALIQGHAGRPAFMSALPDHLTAAQRERVWIVCQEGLQEWGDVIRDKVATLLTRFDLGDIEELKGVGPAKLDQVLRARMKSGENLIVKYAGDTVDVGSVGQPEKPKPRERLSTERRALKWLKTHHSGRVEFPTVVYFDKATWTLVLREMCPESLSVQDQLREGVFDPTIARAAGCFLAWCHGEKSVPPLWGDHDMDVQHWKRMLGLITQEAAPDGLSKKVCTDLARLRLASEEASEKGFFHLDFCPKNLRVCPDRIGIFDFELSSSIGDPAYDFGVFLGHYILWALLTSAESACQESLQEALNGYREGIGEGWRSIGPRTVAFAGATIFHSVMGSRQIDIQGFEPLLLGTATTLLSRGLAHVEDIDQILSRAIRGYFA